MSRTIRQNALNEQGRVPRGTKIFRNKKEMLKFLESLKWREAPESAKDKRKIQVKKIEEIHADVLNNSQKDKKN